MFFATPLIYPCRPSVPSSTGSLPVRKERFLPLRRSQRCAVGEALLWCPCTWVLSQQIQQVNELIHLHHAQGPPLFQDFERISF